MKIIVKGAMVTSYSVSGSDKEQIEGWTLNVESAEFVIPKDAEGDEKGRDNPGYDLAPGKGKLRRSARHRDRSNTAATARAVLVACAP